MSYKTFSLKPKWFSADNPENPKGATADIGTGDNGTVTITVDKVGTEGNDYTVKVVEGDGADVDMSAELTDKDLVVTLGTGSDESLDDNKNTAELVAGEIDGMDAFSAKYSGDGSGALDSPESEKDFTGGQFGTSCPQKNTMVEDDDYYYLCTKEGNKDNVVWKRFTLSDY